jgi:hypothetical protein
MKNEFKESSIWHISCLQSTYSYRNYLDSSSVSTTGTLNTLLREQAAYYSLKWKEAILLFAIYLPI